VSDLALMADGGTPTLLCWEAPPSNPAWCHRALVSAWLFDELGLEVPEVGHEALGFGWQHPKLHPSLMRAASIGDSHETIAAKPTADCDAKWGQFVITPTFFTKLVYEGV